MLFISFIYIHSRTLARVATVICYRLSVGKYTLEAVVVALEYAYIPYKILIL